MHWTHINQPILSIPVGNHKRLYGFVYKITNIQTNRSYIGCKSFFSTTTKTIDGKKRKITSESNWLDYYSSSTELKADVKKLGKEQFTREILQFCSSKDEMLYMEAKWQFELEVLESSKWYNRWISYKGRYLK